MGNLRKSTWLLAAVSGGLQVLIFPTPNLYWLCWIAFVPLLVAVLRARDPAMQMPPGFGDTVLPASHGQAFLMGWLSGIIWSAGGCYWVFHTMHVYGGLDTLTSLGVLILFCLALGVHEGIFTVLLAIIANGAGLVRISVRRALVFAPFLWVGVEYARTRITTFPWDLLGTAQVDNIPLTRLATVTGVYGLSFEILLVNTAFAAALLTRRPGRRVLLSAAIVAAAALQLSIFLQPAPLAATERARLIQQNIPILEAWTPEYYRSTMAQLRQMSLPPPPEEALGQPTSVDLVIWPESPAPFYTNDPLFRQMVSQIAQDAHAYMIGGTLGVENAPPRGLEPQRLYNSASLIAPDGRWVARYDKIHLVPFGEYVPFKAVLGFAHQLVREVGDFVPGKRHNVFDAGPYKVGVFICYESIFPGEVRQFAFNGGEVFVNISNDEWFGHSAAPYQHLNQARMRAIENNRWLLRATNSGITAAVDPYGRVVASAPRDAVTTLLAPYSVISSTTFYTRHGDWFAWLCVIISVVVILGSIPAVHNRLFVGTRNREAQLTR